MTLKITVTRLTEALVDAITAETRTYRLAAPEAECSASTGVVCDVERQLLALPREAMTAPGYVQALALVRRWEMVAEGSYAYPPSRLECRLVDAILRGSPLDKTPLLWHVAGQLRGTRPTEEEFVGLHAAYEAAQ